MSNPDMNAAQLARYIDHTLLAADAQPEQVITLCQEAREYEFYAVCVNSGYVALAVDQLQGSGVAVCSVVGFPLGAMHWQAKAEEACVAIAQGATEIDTVVPIGRLKAGDWDGVSKDIASVREACDQVPLKVIFETCLLDEAEKIRLSTLCRELDVAFVKTSTGFSSGGATLEDVALMRKTVGEHVGVKASGGVRDYATAMAMIDAGATRIGTSSGIAIVTGGTGTSSY